MVYLHCRPRRQDFIYEEGSTQLLSCVLQGYSLGPSEGHKLDRAEATTPCIAVFIKAAFPSTTFHHPLLTLTSQRDTTNITAFSVIKPWNVSERKGGEGSDRDLTILSSREHSSMYV